MHASSLACAEAAALRPPFDSASGLVEALAAGALSATEAVDFSIDRIERLDPLLNAVVVRDFERARAAARRVDERIARGERGPLLGLPMTVKESFHVSGLPTSWGVAALRDQVAPLDSVVVQRLRHAGAIVVGKTNVSTALADWQCDNAVHGLTRNPWNDAHTPGGSSGGSAAALAAGLSALELGSDTAGSIRIPAHHCGVYGHRASAGLVSSQGCEMPTTRCASDLGAIGPLARNVDDLERALRVLAGPGLPESTAWRVALPAPRRDRLGDFKVLVLDHHPLVDTGDAVRAALQRLAGELSRRGVQVARDGEPLPDLTRTTECFVRTLVMQNLARLPRARYAAELAAAPAPGSGGAALLALGRSAVRGGVREWFAAVEERAALTLRWRHCLQAWDVIVCPSATTSAPLHGWGPRASGRAERETVPAACYDTLGWVGIAALAGLPATQIPLGLDPAGLPIGAQVMAAPYADLTALAFARHLERELGGFVPPPAFADF